MSRAGTPKRESHREAAIRIHRESRAILQDHLDRFEATLNDHLYRFETTLNAASVAIEDLERLVETQAGVIAVLLDLRTPIWTRTYWRARRALKEQR